MQAKLDAMLESARPTSKIPTWPKERDLARYAQYTGIDFTRDLSLGKTWIDIGCRTGKALSQTRKLYSAQLVGVNAHPIKVRPQIEAIRACIPEDLEVYNRYYKKADLITDVHGAISYAVNPVAVLIYESCLLKPQGIAVFITLEARFGSSATWKRVQHFFKTFMGQSIKFEKFITYSDNTKTPIKTLRIRVDGVCQTDLGLKELFLEAEQEIGRMQPLKIIGQARDQSAPLWGVQFKKITRT